MSKRATFVTCQRLKCGAEATQKIWFSDGTSSNLCVNHARGALGSKTLGGTLTPAKQVGNRSAVTAPQITRTYIESCSSEQLRKLLANEETREKVEKQMMN